MKPSAPVLLVLSFVLIGCSDEPVPSYRFTIEEVNYGEPSRYVFESVIAPGTSSTFDRPDEIKVEVSRARQSNREVMQIVLFDYFDSQLVSIGSGTIEIPEKGVSLYEWQAQNGNRYKVEVLTGG